MKTPFKTNPRHPAIVAALLALGSAFAAHAAVTVPMPEERSSVRTAIVDSDALTEQMHGNGEMVISRSDSDGKREVRIVTKGSQIDGVDVTPDIDIIVSNAVSEAFSSGGRLPMGKSIKNAPYSAEVISEKVQTLPDGNQITHKTSTMAYRDSAGRTRQETRDSKGEVKTVRIFDAVEGNRYQLTPSKKAATKTGIDKDLQKRIEEIREKAKKMSKDGTAHIVERGNGNGGQEIIVKRVEVPAADGAKGVREEVKVNVMRVNAEPKISISNSSGGRLDDGRAEMRAMVLSDLSPLSGLSELSPLSSLGTLFTDSKWSGKATSTPLGSRNFDGVNAEGKSVSYTIPAGEIGNKNPIVVTTETWTAPDLQVVVYSKHSDPRVGDTIYRLANIKRSEQPMSLFSVPEGYSVRESPGFAAFDRLK